MSMQEEIQKDAILREAFSKNPDDLNAIEEKAVAEFLQRYLDKVHRFMDERGLR